jgi:hypothetical protein
VLAKKADAKKNQIEQERRAAQEARSVLERDEREELARERVGGKEREEVGKKRVGRKGMTGLAARSRGVAARSSSKD